MTVLRWREWDGLGIQHIVLQAADGGIVADGVVVGSDPFAASFRIVIDRTWTARRVEIAIAGGGALLLESDGAGRWMRDGRPAPELDGAMEPDISVTPFTNTFPVKRLRLARGASAEISAAYVDIPSLDVFSDPQRYTCLEEGRLYLYESLNSDFRREVSFGEDGFVAGYPGLFRRPP
jgi:hypothetical protein